MQIASEIQTTLLPSEIPKVDGYDIDAFYRPSKEVGGDYYDVITYNEEYMGFIVADVSGKGVPGSMVMTMARSLIRMEAFRNTSPAKMFSEVNKILAEDIRKGMFVTAMYAFMNLKTGQIHIASAGHNPAVIFRVSQNKNELIGPKGIALGLAKDRIFSRTINEETVQLNPGDRIVLYTDGVPEAMDPANEEFGDDRFYDWVAQNSHKKSASFIKDLVTTLDDWKQDAPQSDDITVVTWKRL
jgi:sigma-B regulation protein RsbU (phosphoserine phosphatase)